MNFYRCQICGDVYMGKEKPTNCPFCGAMAKYLVKADKWVDENMSINTLSEISRKNLGNAIQLEVNNSPFYRDAMNKTKDIKLQGVFKYLSKIEAEHASTIRKILKTEPPQPEPGKDVALTDDISTLNAAYEREKFAAAFYKKASKEAVEPRVRKVFKALSEVESDHMSLEEKILHKK